MSEIKVIVKSGGVDDLKTRVNGILIRDLPNHGRRLQQKMILCRQGDFIETRDALFGENSDWRSARLMSERSPIGEQVYHVSSCDSLAYKEGWLFVETTLVPTAFEVSRGTVIRV